ncbi:MAG: hypothetical protein D6812_07015 [Deltaproteobacteria bacterium]|nr:MAG: hypothetical protein D6812_07015 [Deltaproteobacteria bacterium]
MKGQTPSVGEHFGRLTALADEIAILRNRLEEALQAIHDLPDRSPGQKAELIRAVQRHFLAQIEALSQRLDAALHAIGDEILSSYERQDFLDLLEKKGGKPPRPL